MNKKVIYLTLALVLPVLVFLFLKLFGKNQFDIPVYYEMGVPDAPAECRMIATQPYFLPDSILTVIKWNKGAALLLTDVYEANQKELKRLFSETRLNDLQVISLDNMEADRMKRWRNCILFLKEPWKAVLIDNKKRIRGYYALSSREEIERLEIELEILFKKY